MTSVTLAVANVTPTHDEIYEDMKICREESVGRVQCKRMTSPHRGLGLKQVALGGMSCPASATRMMSDTVTLTTRNATHALLLSTLDSRP